MLRSLLIALIAIGLVGCGAFFWIAMRPPPPPPAPAARIVAAPPATVKVLVAARDIRPGTFLQETDLRAVDFTAASAPAKAERDTPAARRAFDGALVLHAIPAAMLVDRDDLVLRGDHGFLAALLRPGKRAVTIGREVLNADAGLLAPGDRVDVILTQGAANETVGGRKLAAETVIRAVRILAVDRQIVPGPTGGGDHPGEATPPAAIALEVSPDQAERLVIAERLGKLDFALRPSDASPDEPADPPPVAWAGDVMSSLVKPTDPSGPAATVHVFDSGGGDKEYQY